MAGKPASHRQADGLKKLLSSGLMSFGVLDVGTAGDALDHSGILALGGWGASSAKNQTAPLARNETEA